MDFRWVAAIALWTLISGPIMGVPSSSVSSASKSGKTFVKTAKAPLSQAPRR